MKSSVIYLFFLRRYLDSNLLHAKGNLALENWSTLSLVSTSIERWEYLEKNRRAIE